MRCPQNSRHERSMPDKYNARQRGEHFLLAVASGIERCNVAPPQRGTSTDWPSPIFASTPRVAGASPRDVEHPPIAGSSPSMSRQSLAAKTTPPKRRTKERISACSARTFPTSALHATVSSLPGRDGREGCRKQSLKRPGCMLPT